MLSKEGLPLLTASDFYNLNRKGELTKEQEIQVIITDLEEHKFHVQVRYEHLLNRDSGVETEDG
jgi:hypothetical protein